MSPLALYAILWIVSLDILQPRRMTQYDSLGSLYDVMDRLPYRAMEERNVYSTLKYLLPSNPEIIEFACGTGFYTSRLLGWGVESLTAIDISSVMIACAAARLLDLGLSDNVRFIVGDGAKPQSFAHNGSFGQFNVAFGAWFLNYARSKAELTCMFQTISLNLEPGGVFVGIVPHPTNDLRWRAEAYRQQPLNRLFPRNEYTEELDSGDGWGLQVSLDNGGVRFMTWHMKKNIYEEAERLGGMKGTLEWRLEELVRDGWGQEFQLSREELRARQENPHHGILIVRKDG